LGLARLDTSGKVIASTSLQLDNTDMSLYSAVQLEVDELNQILVLVERGFSVQTDAGMENRSESHLYLFDSDLNQIAVWKAPENVRVLAIAPDGHGDVLAAGRRTTQDRAEIWLDMLTLPGFDKVWSEALVDDDGEAAAIDMTPSGDFIVAGRDATTKTYWIQHYDAAGKPVWSDKVRADSSADWVDEGDTILGPIAAVSLQSDGSIFLSIENKQYTYCE
jgi:hypothetical protein